MHRNSKKKKKEKKKKENEALNEDFYQLFL